LFFSAFILRRRRLPIIPNLQQLSATITEEATRWLGQASTPRSARRPGVSNVNPSHPIPLPADRFSPQIFFSCFLGLISSVLAHGFSWFIDLLLFSLVADLLYRDYQTDHKFTLTTYTANNVVSATSTSSLFLR
jgi:hypothetical protein